MTINSELRVGLLEETLTVTGAALTVDAQSTTKAQALNREALDAFRPAAPSRAWVSSSWGSR